MRSVILLGVLTACNNDFKSSSQEIKEGVIRTCTEESNAFDIEDVSTLQDAMSGTDCNCLGDAVVIDWSGEGLASDVTWRVSSVEILIMIPEDLVSSFQDGNTMRVSVYDADNPLDVAPYVQELEVNRVDLFWDAYTLAENAAHAGVDGEFEQVGAWMPFDFREIIPATGMSSRKFLVGVEWPEPKDIAVGYSNFNRSCSYNWTNYGDGWIRNSERANSSECSWPMMRIHVEETYPGECD